MTVNEHLLDEYLARKKPVYKVYEPSDVTIVLGAGRMAEKDVLLENTRIDGVTVLKRKGGGGTVVLSPGQVVLTLVKEVHSPFNNIEYAHAINRWFKETLSALGIGEVDGRGTSDLAIRDRKILGAALYRRGLILFYQASLLVNNDLSLFDRYLLFPSKAAEYRRGRSHGEFCTTLHLEGFVPTVSRVMQTLNEVVKRNLSGLF